MGSNGYIPVDKGNLAEMVRDYKKHGGKILVSDLSPPAGDAEFDLFSDVPDIIMRDVDEAYINTLHRKFDRNKSKSYILAVVPDMTMQTESGIFRVLFKPRKYKFVICELIARDTNLIKEGPTLYIPDSKSIAPAFEYALDHLRDKIPVKERFTHSKISKKAKEKIVGFVMEDIQSKYPCEFKQISV